MNYGIDKLGASVTGSFMYTQPFFATIASMLILHESLSWPKVAAAALIMFGVFITNMKKKLF
jgi:drug/metabolite transporter (DMT)-like permease